MYDAIVMKSKHSPDVVVSEAYRVKGCLVQQVWQ